VPHTFSIQQHDPIIIELSHKSTKEEELVILLEDPRKDCTKSKKKTSKDHNATIEAISKMTMIKRQKTNAALSKRLKVERSMKKQNEAIVVFQYFLPKSLELFDVVASIALYILLICLTETAKLVPFEMKDL